MLFKLFICAQAFAQPGQTWLQKQDYKGSNYLKSLLSQEEITQFTKQTHQHIIQHYAKSSFSCRNFAKVGFPFKENPQQELQKTYGLETAVCIPDFSLEKAFSLYMDPAFRTKHMTGVASATRKDNSICITTDSILGIVEAAHFCMDFTEQRTQDRILLYNTLSYSKHKDYQPVYFQEEFILFQQFNNDVLIHRLSLNRSRELG